MAGEVGEMRGEGVGEVRESEERGIIESERK